MSTPLGWGDRQSTLKEDELLYKVDRRATANGDDDDESKGKVGEDDRRNNEARRLYERNDGLGGSLPIMDAGGNVPIGWGNRQTTSTAEASKPVDSQTKSAPVASPFGDGSRHEQQAPMPSNTGAMSELQISPAPATSKKTSKRCHTLAFPANATPKMMDAAVYSFALQHLKEEVGECQEEVNDIDMEIRRLVQKKQQAVKKWQQKTLEMQNLETRVRGMMSM